MRGLSAALHARIISRAGDRCEYCQIAQAGQEATFHIDHVVPRNAGGSATEDNLALACVSCSLRKWAKQFGIDPDSGNPVPLFNPRTQAWTEHFRWEGEMVVPLTATGRVTAAELSMNRPLIVAIRKEEALLGRHPSGANA
jgi:HNH endonuclease